MSERKVCKYIVNHIEELYDPFFESIVVDSFYNAKHDNSLCKYLYKIFIKKKIAPDCDDSIWIEIIQNFYKNKTDDEIIESLQFYGSNGNKEDCVISLFISQNVKIVSK
jgi:hypothetical protein